MLLFRNKGLIDLRALKTFGWSAKECDNPIGFFGTGSRFALATLLRTDHKVTLYRGLDRHTFSVSTVTGRADKSFDVVVMTGPDGPVEMPFTLQLGKMWQVWQAYRELHSNVLDEGGETMVLDRANAFVGSIYSPRADETAFVVEGDEIEKVHAKRDTIFLSTLSRGASSGGVAVHDGANLHAYYRGVRVADLRAPSLFTYNLIESQNLTEDRTLDTFNVDYAICKAIAASQDEAFLAKVLAPPQSAYESSLPAYAMSQPSEAFMTTYLKLCQSERMADISSFAASVYRAHRGVPPLPEPLKLNRIQQSQLDRAIGFCEKMGWAVREYPIVVIPRVTGGTLAVAKDGHIVLTEELFDIGTKKLCHALLEEWTHLKTGLHDETRSLQTHLFQQVLSLAEQVVGEAL